MQHNLDIIKDHKYKTKNDYKGLAMPRMIHRKSFLNSETPLAHVAHTMRNIEFEISVFGGGTSLGYRLTFVAEGGARGEKFNLTTKLSKCLSVLKDEEVSSLLEEAISDNLVNVNEDSDGGLHGGLHQNDMMKVYTR